MQAVTQSHALDAATAKLPSTPALTMVMALPSKVEMPSLHLIVGAPMLDDVISSLRKAGIFEEAAYAALAIRSDDATLRTDFIFEEVIFRSREIEAVIVQTEKDDSCGGKLSVGESLRCFMKKILQAGEGSFYVLICSTPLWKNVMCCFNFQRVRSNLDLVA